MPLRRFASATARTLCQTCWAAKADMDPRGAKRCRGGGGRKLRARTVSEELLCGAVVGEGGGASCLSFFSSLSVGREFCKVVSSKRQNSWGKPKTRGLCYCGIDSARGAVVSHGPQLGQCFFILLAYASFLGVVFRRLTSGFTSLHELPSET